LDAVNREIAALEKEQEHQHDQQLERLNAGDGYWQDAARTISHATSSKAGEAATL